MLTEGQTVTANGETYTIIRLLARGKGGYNYLAESKSGRAVIKQIHYEPCDYFQFEENKLESELRDYQTLYEIGIPMPKLLYANQEKQFLIKEYIPGDTLAKTVADGKLSKNHISQILSICEKLYPRQLNIDYFPTNFMERQRELLYVDYECSRYSDEWNFENWGIYFLANAKGMKEFIENNDYASILENGKPIKTGFTTIVNEWLFECSSKRWTIKLR
jgi:tRNA A-37 threonylcarbamoyl transferase component Bud32